MNLLYPLGGRLKEHQEGTYWGIRKSALDIKSISAVAQLEPPSGLRELVVIVKNGRRIPDIDLAKDTTGMSKNDLRYRKELKFIEFEEGKAKTGQMSAEEMWRNIDLMTKISAWSPPMDWDYGLLFESPIPEARPAVKLQTLVRATI